MYLDFYNLRKEPFNITPDPEFLFLSPGHKEALASVIYGIEQRKGFIVITGDVGLGKTTIIRSYLDRISREKFKIIYIFNPNVTYDGLLKSIFQGLGFVAETNDPVELRKEVFLSWLKKKKYVTETNEPVELVNRLHRVLIDEFSQGHSVVLIIDEAQNMPVETLENLRMLSNLETSREKLLQILLVGQQEFEQTLNLPELRQLRQRIAVRARISPFTETESLSYIKHRIAKAGGSDPLIFTKGALKKIVKQARGIPRVINILCDNALITGFGYQKKRITSRIAREVIQDLKPERKPFFLKWAVALFSFILLVFGVFWYSENRDQFLLRKQSISIFQSAQNQDLTGTESSFLYEKLGTALNKTNDPLAVKEGGPEQKTEPAGSVQSYQVKDSTKTEYLPVHAKLETTQAKINNLPIVEEDISKQNKISVPVTVIVKKGDQLMNLIRQVYGFCNQELVTRVRQKNRTIANGNKIFVGQRIVFPDLKQDTQQNTEISPKRMNNE